MEHTENDKSHAGAPSGLNVGLEVRHRHEIIADLVEARKRIYDLEQCLHEIGNFAHYRSTGPEEPDALWEIRSMAYKLL